MTTIAGWRVRVEVGQLPRGAAMYDDPAATYGVARYDAASAVEMSWVSINCQVRSVDCARGTDARGAPYIVAEAGTLTARLHDPDRLLDPTISTGSVFAEPGVPVRVVATREGAPLPGGGVYDSSRYDSGAVYGEDTLGGVPIWSGYADTWTHDLRTGEGTLTASDVLARLAGTRISDFDRPAESTVDRIGAIIGALGDDAPPTTYHGTGAMLSAAALSGDCRSLLAKVAESSMSWVWATAAGALAWKSRSAVMADPVPLVDCDDGSSAVYTGMSSAAMVQRIVNRATLQRVRADAAEQAGSRLYQVSESVDRYGESTYAANDLQLLDDASVDLYAQALFDLRAWPRPHLATIDVLTSEAFPWAARSLTRMVGVDVGDTVTVSLSSRGDPAQVFGSVVTGVSHSIVPGEWLTTLDVAPYTLLDAPQQPGGVGRYDEALYGSGAVYGTEVGTGIPPGASPAAGLYDDPEATYDGVAVYDTLQFATTGRW